MSAAARLGTRRVKLGDVAIINPTLSSCFGKDAPKEVAFLPMAAVSDSGTYEAVTRSFEDVKKGYTPFAVGDVLLAKITPCMENGKAAHISELCQPMGFASTEFHVIRSGSDIDCRYLFYMVWSDRFRALASRNMTGSAGQKRVPADFVARYEIPLPSLSEQKRIAAILDKAGRIRQKCDGFGDLVGELVNHRFRELFSATHNMRMVGDIAQVQGGIQVTPRRVTCPLELPYLRVANVFRDRLDLREVKSIRVTPHEMDRVSLKSGDILIVEGHGNKAEIGRSAVWNDEIPVCVHQNHLIRVRVDPSVAAPDYVNHAINSGDARSQIARFSGTTSGLNTISTADVKTLTINLPTLAEQVEFGRLTQYARRLRGLLLQRQSAANQMCMTLEAAMAFDND